LFYLDGYIDKCQRYNIYCTHWRRRRGYDRYRLGWAQDTVTMHLPPHPFIFVSNIKLYTKNTIKMNKKSE